MSLKMTNYHGFQTLQSESLNVAPYFLSSLKYRINKKLATNVVVTGEAGIGKSYMAMDICRMLEGKKASGEDRFTIDQVVFNYSEFMDLVLQLKPGRCIVFDEPSYAMGKREWYRELNQALTKTIESFRFKIHPLFLPIINKGLLDKTIRDHLIQYQVHVVDRGKANVYRLRPSQFMEKTYHAFFCELSYGMLDSEECDRPSCLDCEKVEACPIFRAKYERKKAAVQESRYEQARDRSATIESKMMTLSELETLALKVREKWFIDGRIHIQKLRIALKDAHDISISQNKAYHLKAQLESHHQELSEQ